MNYEPSAPPCKVFFFLRRETMVQRAAVYLRPTLPERAVVSAILAFVPVEKKLLKTVVRETYEA